MKATLTIEDQEEGILVKLELDPPLGEQTEPTQASYVVNELVRRLTELVVPPAREEVPDAGPSRN